MNIIGLLRKTIKQTVTVVEMGVHKGIFARVIAAVLEMNWR